MNALLWNRDLTKSVSAIRADEAGMNEKGRGAGTVALPELRHGQVAVCMATVLARIDRPDNPLRAYSYRSGEIAAAQAWGQLAYYEILARQGRLRFITDAPQLQAHLQAWEAAGQGDNGADWPPLGIILAMEGADPLLEPEDVHRWWQRGLRVIGLAHYGPGIYAHGTQSEGGLTPAAGPLLRAMAEAGIILDVTHLAEESFWQVLERYPGRVLASHCNCRALVPGDRQLSDAQIKALLERGAVIGVALDAWMLYPGWVKGVTPNTVVSLSAVADHIDHICQLAGNARHAAIGSDLDGGFGREQTPHDVDTIADLQRLVELLERRGYSAEAIAAIFHGNWVRLFTEAWSHPPCRRGAGG